MGTFQFSIPMRRPLAEVFASTPPSVRAALRRGFLVIATLSTSESEKLLSALLRQVTAGGPLPETELRSLLANVGVEDAKAALAAGSFLAVGISSTDEGVEQVITGAVNAKIFAETDAPGVRRFAALVARNRDEFQRGLERQRLAKSVLPSLTMFETLVDLRPSFVQNGFEFAIPVVLVHIDTDAPGQEVWFQASKGQLENIVRELHEALHRVVEAEKWVSKSLLPPA